MEQVIFFILGVAAVYIGANLLVLGAAKFSKSIGVSPLIIGLTIVGIGTSLPETVVGIISGIKKVSEVSFGNIIGANIYDLCVIIGVSSLIRPLVVENAKLLFRELRWMTFSFLVLLLFCSDGEINAINGILLIFLQIIYLYYCYSSAKKERQEAELLEKETAEFIAVHNKRKPILYFSQLVAGLTIIIFGGEILVRAAIEIATMLNVKKEFIGMTILSFGTALPEFTTSVVATIKKEFSLAIGNVIGTVIYNTLAIIGIVSILSPIEVSSAFFFYRMPALVIVSVLLFFISNSGSKISRKEGFVLVCMYLLFLTISILTRTK
jgi:cation:H+ antiporter